MVSSQTASQSELDASRVPLGWRDQCSAHKTLYAPWACEDERHGYEKCQYDEYVVPQVCPAFPLADTDFGLGSTSYMRRMKQLSAQKKAAAEAADEE
ncbi:hypothetical protein QFC19_008191 [Naganishia cerealis]|uniref:Uncharacterized protein n=1 Tax=Naganishia cerealis TaxID=610337 RepID=A0ACC2V3Q0_9TREE|nr:hypothetical protein QFC19_008191 [Naganishia cerealis]